MALQLHQVRVVNEKNELDEKLAKLEKFFATDIYLGLPSAERGLLRVQCHLMRGYSEVLGERIAAF